MEMTTILTLLSLLIIIIFSLFASKKTAIADVVFYLIGGLIAVNLHLLSSESVIIELFAFIGTIFLFFYLGLEENLHSFMVGVQKGWKIAIAGVILPFGAVYGIQFLLTHNTIHSIVFAMAFAPTSIGIAFLTLNTLQFKAKEHLQPIIVAAALTDDVISLILWGVLGGMLVSLGSTGGAISLQDILALALPPIESFFLFSLIMGAIAYLFFLFHPIDALHKNGLIAFLTRTKASLYSHAGAGVFLGKQEENAAIVMMIFLAFLGSMIADFFGTSVALGAYFMGLIINKDHFTVNQQGGKDIYHEASEKLRFLTLYFFAPIFFINIGLHMEIKDFSSLGGLLLSALLLSTIVFIAQFIAASFTARFINHLPWRSAMVIGIAMQGRAEVTFLVAIAALSLKLISNTDLFLISLSAFILNLSVPFLLKVTAAYHERWDHTSVM